MGVPTHTHTLTAYPTQQPTQSHPPWSTVTPEHHCWVGVTKGVTKGVTRASPGHSRQMQLAVLAWQLLLPTSNIPHCIPRHTNGQWSPAPHHLGSLR
jgi:hypothetical protein